MGQKREQTIEVEFTEADKECLVRLVKELVAKGAQGDKVRRGISPSQKDGSPRQQLRHPIPEPAGRLQGMAQGDAEGSVEDQARSR
jgi:hypothetical protein